jgi:hypothetical protein
VLNRVDGCEGHAGGLREFRSCNRVSLFLQEKASRLDYCWLFASSDDVTGVFCIIRAPGARVLDSITSTSGFDSQSGVLVVEESVVCCRSIALGSAVFGLEWRSAVCIVSEGVIHLLRPVVVFPAVLILMVEFNTNVCGDGLVEGPSGRSSHDLHGCCLAFRVGYGEVY